jgi:glucose/arabinose dehydrogenase
MKLTFLFLSIISIFLFLTACNTVSRKNFSSKKEITEDSIHVKLKLVSEVPELPVELNMPDKSGRSFITDNHGKIWILKNESVLPRPFFNIFDKIGKQQKNSVVGLVYSVAFDPQFASNHKFYVCYNPPSKPGADSKLVVAQFNCSLKNPDAADVASEQTVIEFKGTTLPYEGAQMAFGPDGYLYISVGDDRANDTNYHYHSQDLHYFNGKLLRIDVKKLPYSVPPDNPFIHIKNARPEIWAYGFRKLWHFSFDPRTGLLLGGDVGQDKQEEIDIVKKGANYGWPVMEGDSVYEKNDQSNMTAFVPPVNTYSHKTGICIIGGNFYYGNEIPGLKNKYVFADWKDKLFALSKDKYGNWERQPVKMINPPAGSFFICGCSQDLKNQLFVMGYTVTDSTEKGAIYKVLKG